MRFNFCQEMEQLLYHYLLVETEMIDNKITRSYKIELIDAIGWMIDGYHLSELATSLTKTGSR